MRQGIFSPQGPRITATGLGGVRLFNGPRLSNLGAVDPFAADESGSGTDWAALIQKAQLAYNTQQLFDLNVSRAQQGLPPIQAQTLAPTLNFGVDTSTQRTLLLIAAGIALALLLRGKRG